MAVTGISSFFVRSGQKTTLDEGLAYTWNENNEDTWGFSSHLYPTAGVWQFVAMVIEPSQATLYLVGTNGVVKSATDAIAQDSEKFAVAWHIRDDAYSDDGGRTFPGSISSVSVFLSALSPSQIQPLADAGLGITPPSSSVTLTIAPSTTVPGSLSVSWPQGTLMEATNLLGPWTTTTASSPYLVLGTNAEMFFKVLVP
jgi:hypothetical protein